MKDSIFSLLNRFSIVIAIFIGIAIFIFFMENIADFRGRRSGVMALLVNTLGVGLTSLLIGGFWSWFVYAVCSKLPVKKPVKSLKGKLLWDKMFGKINTSTRIIITLIVIVILLLVFGLNELSDLRSEINKSSRSVWGSGFRSTF